MYVLGNCMLSTHTSKSNAMFGTFSGTCPWPALRHSIVMAFHQCSSISKGNEENHDSWWFVPLLPWLLLVFEPVLNENNSDLHETLKAWESMRYMIDSGKNCRHDFCWDDIWSSDNWSVRVRKFNLNGHIWNKVFEVMNRCIVFCLMSVTLYPCG